ncbi:MAG TPA: sensor histidine kinase KdpD [Verrucomicrobiales bacterium]|nr:sensor histidine kinase KdpD [Verrucomicrobiales bacterium]
MNSAPDERPDPDALLASMQREETQSKAGKLFIFLGMCPGVGKTFAMLQAARQRYKEGVNLLVGLVETHGRAETLALLDGLNVLHRRKMEYRGRILEEFDIDAVLQQRPDLVLVDELAHTNAPGSRHAKRCQDVLELIGAGIDVYTTLNVQHIESQVDIVRQITGVAIQETVPDSILDQAHEIQLIDLGVEKLLERMAEGKVYMGERAEQAVSHFFKEGNLTALRELALRFTAERVDRDLEDIRRSKRVSSPWKTSARLLVGVGPSPYAESLIRWTRRTAGRLNCPWLVVWVEGLRSLNSSQQETLTRALGLARKLGAEIVPAAGDDVASVLLRVARERNVSQIVVGKPESRSRFRKSLADRLIDESGDIDVCVIRPLASGKTPAVSTMVASPAASLVGQYGWVAALVFILTSLGSGLATVAGYMVVALLFLLAVVVAALRMARGPVLVLSALLALSWNFFFIQPSFTFFISKPEDIVMFGLFFVVAISMGHLTSRLRQRERVESRRQRETAALLQFTQQAALATGPANGVPAALRLIEDLFRIEVALVERSPDQSLDQSTRAVGSRQPAGKEWGVINWAFENRHPAGRFTDTLPDSSATWFPVQTSTSIMGVLGVWLPRETSLDFGMRQTLEAFVLQLALVLEKEHIIQAVNRAELLEQSEKLRRTLLDSVSHELKTPLAVIHAALDGLGEDGNPYVSEIRTANQRLQRVVSHLLQMTQIESSVVEPHREWCDVSDIVRSAQESVRESLAGRMIELSVPPDLPAVKVDAMLIAQAIANMLHNAALYTPAGTPVQVSVSLAAGSILTIVVRDHGPGLPSGEEELLFAKFYRSPGSPAGGTGLGLAIVRGFVQAHGGTVSARNRPDGGAEFTLALPVETATV